MAPPFLQPDASTPAPDWATQQEDILCSLCDYNLRGLTKPRCPECGYRFTWPELLDEARRRHPYLFEQPLHRPIWSFFRTAIGGLAPARFWKSIHPALPVRPGRLLVYWVMVLLPLLLTMGVVIVSAITSYLAQSSSPAWGIPTRLPPRTINWGMIDGGLVKYYLWPMLAWCCWPPLLFLTLMIFRMSMRRARVRTAHVLRCITYSCDSLLLLNLPTLALAASDYFQPGPRGWRYTSRVDAWIFWAMILWILLTTWRLRQAYRHYLRFDHPLATVLVSQLIVFLVVIVVLLQLGYVR